MSCRSSLIALVASLGLAACLPPQPSAPPAQPELQLVTYSVDPALSARTQGVLRRLLRPGSDDAQGTISEAPGGRIAVLAPASVQAGVAALIGELGGAAAEESAPANLRFAYWVVEGRPSADAGSASPDLEVLQDTLATVAQWDGAQDFRLIGHTTLTSLDGDRGAARSQRLSISQTAALDAPTGSIVADIDLELILEEVRRLPELETRVQLESGQTLVLSTLNGAESGRQFYVIVRADQLSRG